MKINFKRKSAWFVPLTFLVAVAVTACTSPGGSYTEAWYQRGPLWVYDNTTGLYVQVLGGGGSGNATWGAITGNITSQTDLQTQFGTKQSTSQKGAANGYAGLGANSLVPTAQLGTGTANSTTFLRGDQTYSAGPVGPTGPQGPPGASGGAIYYLDDAASTGILGYFQLLVIADTATPQVEDSASSSGTEVLISAYATEPNEPATTVIHSGSWMVHYWAKTSGGNASHLVARFYIRTVSGNETEFLRLESAPLSSSYALNPEEMEGAVGNLTVNTTDRVVVKFYAYVTSGTRTVYYTHNGQTQYTHVMTPIQEPDIDPYVQSVSGTGAISSTGGVTPVISIATANATTTGALSDTDWTSFNNKLSATLSSNLTVDHTWTGLTATFTAGENVTLGDAVYINSTAGKLKKALATATSTMPAVAIATATINQDATGTFILLGTSGFIRDDSWSWTIGGYIYVSKDTAGALTQTQPTGTGIQVQIVGLALTAHEIMLISPTVIGLK